MTSGDVIVAVGMADFQCSDKYLDYESFINNLERMSRWSEEKWNQEPVVCEDFGKIIGGMKYWARVLKGLMADDVLMLMVYDEGKLVKWSELKWINWMRKVGIIDNFSYFIGTRNPMIMGIKTKSKEGKVILENALYNNEEGMIIDLDMFNRISECCLRVHWLPKDYHEKEFNNLISKYVEIIEMNREIIVVDEKLSYPSKILNIRGILRVENEDMIPHLLKFKNIEVLFVVQGRSPLCLRCEKLGHKAFECPNVFCKMCRNHHVKGNCDRMTTLEKTYAQSVTGDKKNFEMLNYQEDDSSCLSDKKKREEETEHFSIGDKARSENSEIQCDSEANTEDPYMDFTIVSNKKRPSESSGKIEKKNTKIRIESTVLKTYGKSSVSVVTKNPFDALAEREDDVDD